MKSISLWLPEYKKIDEGTAEPGTYDPVEVCSLSDSARLSSSKILIEVEEHKLAEDVLNSLLDENEDVRSLLFIYFSCNSFLTHGFFAGYVFMVFKWMEFIFIWK